MSKHSTLGGFAFACFLFAAIVFGVGLAAVIFPNSSVHLFWHPFAWMLGILALQGCTGLLAVLATILGACAFQSAMGKIAAIGGAVVLIGDVAYLLWAFSLG